MAFFLKEHHYFRIGEMLRGMRNSKHPVTDWLYLFGCVRLISDYCERGGEGDFAHQVRESQSLYTEHRAALLENPVAVCLKLIDTWQTVGDPRITAIFDAALLSTVRETAKDSLPPEVAMLVKLFFPKSGVDRVHGISRAGQVQEINYFFESLSKARFLFYGDPKGWGDNPALNRRFTTLYKQNYDASFMQVIASLLLPNASRLVLPLASDLPIPVEAKTSITLSAQSLHYFSQGYVALKCFLHNIQPELLTLYSGEMACLPGDAVFLDLSPLDNQNWLPPSVQTRAKADPWQSGDRAPLSERLLPQLLSSLKRNSRAMVLTHSAIGSRTLRQQLVESGSLEAVVHLPRGLIQAGWRCVLLLLNTEKVTDDVYFYDASEDGGGEGQQVRLNEGGVATIIQCIKAQIVDDSPYSGQSVIVKERTLAEQEYLLEVHRYLKPRTFFDADEVDMREVALERHALSQQLYQVTEAFRETERHLLATFADCPEFDQRLRGETPL